MEIKIGNDLLRVLDSPPLNTHLDPGKLALSVAVAMDDPNVFVSQYVVYDVGLVFFEPANPHDKKCMGKLDVASTVKYLFEFPVSIRKCGELKSSVLTGRLYGERFVDKPQQVIKTLPMLLYYDGEWVLDLMETVKKI